MRPADIAIFFDFVPPPYGGGNQFLRALSAELGRRGLVLENNTISPATRACLFNSYNFDAARLKKLRRSGCRMVHRVDGPIGLYRGKDDGTDREIWSLNRALADATVFQSQYSFRKHVEAGLDFNDPVIIPNAADPDIFNTANRVAFHPGRKIRLISTSWSDNPNKGAATYAWLENHLDWNRYEYTFVGRSAVPFERIRTVAAIPSVALADELRQADIYIAASLHDPCSNALLEALNCGLPAVYAESGGHGELVREAGFGFSDRTQIPALLDRLVEEYAVRQARIAAPSIADVTDRYLDAMGLPTARPQ